MFYLTMHSTHFIYGYMEGRKEARKEMFYLTMHSTHFIYSYMEGRQEASISIIDQFGLTFFLLSLIISHSGQCSTTGVPKAVVCAILSVGCI